jgi:hypothetical protein
MPIVYLVPGLGGTSLGTTPSTTSDTWVSYTAIAQGYIGRLRLAADGVSPGPPDGVQLYFGRPLPDYYQRCIVALVTQLGPQGYVVLDHGYDWRLSALELGQDLADRIIAGVTPADPCTLVAHSYGGIVSRLAWAALVAAGKSGLVRRIITLGTPHWGSYGAIVLWSLAADQLNQIFYLSTPSAVLTSGINPPGSARVWPTAKIAALVSTFPSLYWTLTSLLAPDAGEDPHRSAIYGTAWPANVAVNQTWLQAAKNTWQPLLASASTIPPSWVLTTVAGVGLPTVNALVNPQVLGQSAAYSTADVGDGTVTSDAALLGGSAQYTLTASHQDLPNVAAEQGFLAGWITDPRGPPSPPPPAVVIPGQLSVQLAGPPSPQYIFPSIPIPVDP